MHVVLLSSIVMALVVGFVTAQAENDVVTWTKPGIRYRAREITMQRRLVTVTEIQTSTPTVTLAVRSLIPPVKRSVKRAFLNGWSSQSCVADDEHLPPMVSPFSYQLSSEEVAGSSCMEYCDERGSSLAATQNGNECWCGERSEASDITSIDRSKCDIPCAAEPGEMCGGKDGLTVYTKASA